MSSHRYGEFFSVARVSRNRLQTNHESPPSCTASAFAMPAAASADDQSIHTIQPDSGILSNGSVFIHFTRSFTASSVSTKSVNLASGAFPFIWWVYQA